MSDEKKSPLFVLDEDLLNEMVEAEAQDFELDVKYHPGVRETIKRLIQKGFDLHLQGVRTGKAIERLNVTPEGSSTNSSELPNSSNSTKSAIGEKLFSAYSWIVDANIPMGKRDAKVLLQAADRIAELEAKSLSDMFWKNIASKRFELMVESQAQVEKYREALERYAEWEGYAPSAPMLRDRKEISAIAKEALNGE